MFEWLKKLTATEATLFAACLAAVITIVVTFFTLVLKEYLFPILVEHRQARKKETKLLKLMQAH